MSEQIIYTCDGCNEDDLDDVARVEISGKHKKWVFDLCRHCEDIVVNEIRFRLGEQK